MLVQTCLQDKSVLILISWDLLKCNLVQPLGACVPEGQGSHVVFCCIHLNGPCLPLGEGGRVWMPVSLLMVRLRLHLGEVRVELVWVRFV